MKHQTLVLKCKNVSLTKGIRQPLLNTKIQIPPPVLQLMFYKSNSRDIRAQICQRFEKRGCQGLPRVWDPATDDKKQDFQDCTFKGRQESHSTPRGFCCA